jgi:thiol-disulfide isomerase/thioredoxin
MTIDALRVTTKISGKTGRNRWIKRGRRPNFLRLRRNSGQPFWPKKICHYVNSAVVLFAAMRFRAYFTICVCLLVAASAFAADEDGTPAPRFHAKTTSGEIFNNDSIKGKVVLLEFWASWCKYCEQEEPLGEKINKEFAGKGLVVLAIDVAESKKTVKKYLQEHPRACRIVLTEDTNLAAMYQANVYPIYVVIDRDGNIAGEQRGAAGERALRRLLTNAGIETEEKADEN